MKCEYSIQIDKDLKRSMYKNDTIFIEKVRNVLTNYSIRNSSIGYCQGFNFIVEKIMKIMANNEVYYLFKFKVGRHFLGFCTINRRNFTN